MVFCMYLQKKNRLTDIEYRPVVAKGNGEWGTKGEGLGIWG